MLYVIICFCSVGAIFVEKGNQPESPSHVGVQY